MSKDNNVNKDNEVYATPEEIARLIEEVDKELDEELENDVELQRKVEENFNQMRAEINATDDPSKKWEIINRYMSEGVE